MEIQRFTAEYIRALSRDPGAVEEVRSALDSGRAYESTARMAVMMLDISGYSKMSADLTFLGKMASEIITVSIGSYLNQIIDVISLYNGDIVKFLGDAILVTFARRYQEESEGQLVLRAIACCLHVMSACPVMDLDMTLAERNAIINGSREEVTYPADTGAPRVSKLRLHAAITAGEVSRVIVGDFEDRMDYFVFGDCMAGLGSMLDSTKVGEMGVTGDALRSLGHDVKNRIYAAASWCTSEHCVFDADGVQKLAFDLLQFSEDAEAETVAREFMASVGQPISMITPSTEAKDCEIRRGSSRSRNGGDRAFLEKFLNLATRLQMETALQFLNFRTTKNSKFNREDAEAVEQTYEASIDAEFRSVATVFVSLNFPFDLIIVQQVVSCFLKALKKHGGIFSQYACDDKGQTLLALFGLPPYTHINNSGKCVLAMIDFHRQLQKLQLLPHVHLAISIATGELLFTAVGNKNRSETSHLGDVVITAARLIATAKKEHQIVVDDVTNENIKLLIQTRDLGSVKVKGKTQPLQVYGVPFLAGSSSQRLYIQSNTAGESGAQSVEAEPFFGYEKERGVIVEQFESWRKDGKRAVMFVEGGSGLGKSSLGNYLTDLARKAGVPICLSQATERDQWTPFNGLRRLVLFIIHHTQTAPESSEIRPSLLTPQPSLLAPKSTFLEAPNANRMGLSAASRQVSMTSIPRDAHTADHTAKALILLRKAGVELELAPLLSVVLSGVTMPETERTRAIDGPARNNLLKSILTKMIAAFVDSTAAVLIFDDTQWLDSSTLDVLAQTARDCPKIFMQVLSRPLKDSKVAAMNSVVDLPDTKHLVLAGLSESETNDITNWKLTRLTLHIRAVDGEVLHAIYARTQGNPLFLHMILEVAIGRIGTALEITEDGLLRRTTAYASPILDLKAAVMFMFDRLNPIFQRLLKAASILGQYFILKDVLDILSLELSEEEALEIMREEDVYSFIEYPESGSQTLNEDVVSPILITAASGNTSDVKSAGSVGMKLAFRHIGVMGAIYDLLSFEERIEMNKYIAGVLESLLTDERKDALLPSIEFHYSRTGEIEKIIQYREMIGCRLIKNFHCIEGIRTLESLIQFVSDLQDDASTDHGVTRLRRASWHAHLCAGYTVMDSYPKERTAALQVLELIDNQPWPDTDRQFRRALSSARRRALWLWMRTSGGRKPIRPLKGDGSEINQIFEMKQMVFRNVTMCLGRDTTFAMRDSELILYSFLIHLLMHNSDMSTLAFCLLKLTYFAQYFSPRLRQYFYQAATRFEITDHSCMHSLAWNTSINSNITKMTAYLQKFATYCEMRGDAVQTVVTLYSATGIAYLAGDLDYVERVANPAFAQNILLKENKFLTFLAGITNLRVAHCRGRDLSEIDRLMTEFEPFFQFGHAINHTGGLEEMCFAWTKAYHGDYTESLRLLEVLESKVDITAPGTVNLDNIPATFLCTALFFDKARSDVPIPVPGETRAKATGWDRDELARMTGVLSRLAAKANKIKHVVPIYWALQGFLALELALRGRAAVGIRLLKLRLHSRKRKLEIDYLKFFRGVFCGFIGKYSKHDESYGEKARQIFNDVGSPVYLRWLEA